MQAGRRDLERAAGRALLHRTGILEVGPADGALVTSTLAAARLHELPHEVLDAGALMRRFVEEVRRADCVELGDNDDLKECYVCGR